MTPEVVAALRSELKLDEGERFFVYDDSSGKPIVKGTTVQGNPTISIGRNLASRGITRAESGYLFANDLAACEAELEPLLPWLDTLSANRQCAVLCLYFNLYLGNPAHFVASWPNFLEQMRTGQFEVAAENLESTQPWASEVGTRATRLANLVRNG